MHTQSNVLYFLRQHSGPKFKVPGKCDIYAHFMPDLLEIFGHSSTKLSHSP